MTHKTSDEYKNLLANISLATRKEERKRRRKKKKNNKKMLLKLDSKNKT